MMYTSPVQEYRSFPNLRYIAEGDKTKVINVKRRPMMDGNQVEEIIGNYIPFVNDLDWENGKFTMAGGFVSRIITNTLPDQDSESFKEGFDNCDVDLFMYGDYQWTHVRDLIQSVIDGGSKMFKKHIIRVRSSVIDISFESPCKKLVDGYFKNSMMFQIICGNCKDPIDVINNFDTTYVQCLFDGNNIQCTQEFIDYTQWGLTLMLVPIINVKRLEKMEKRGFSMVCRKDQRFIYNFNYDTPVNPEAKTAKHFTSTIGKQKFFSNADEATKEVKLDGDFSPLYVFAYKDQERCDSHLVKANVWDSFGACVSVLHEGQTIETNDNCGNRVVFVRGDTIVYLPYKCVSAEKPLELTGHAYIHTDQGVSTLERIIFDLDAEENKKFSSIFITFDELCNLMKASTSMTKSSIKKLISILK